MKASKKTKNPTAKNINKTIERFEGDSIVIDTFGNEIDVIKAIEQADEDIETLQTVSVHFRWSKREITRCKKIADKKGLKYQTYIKSVLKQTMDKDEAS
jgi:predicted DNA binding CopG/RHH family protein